MPELKLSPCLLRRLADIQRDYASRFQEGRYYPAEKIAGLDCSYRGDIIVCGGVILGRDGRTLEEKTVRGRVFFPYISGFFAFREGPWLLALIKRFSQRPDLVFVDGNGLLHPRRAGLAVFVGIRSGLPVVGVSKRPTEGLIWECQGKAFYLNGGFALCRPGWKRPVYISPGNLLTPEEALKAYEENSPAKIPPSLRKAHLLARRLLY